MRTPTRRPLAALAAVLAVLAVIIGTAVAVRLGSAPTTTVGRDDGSSSGSVRGSTPATPPPPATDQPNDAPASRFESAKVSADGRTVTVTFYGGVAECYSYELLMEESADAVFLRLKEHSRVKGQPCIELAVRREASARLDQPLGERKLVDAESGAEVTAAGQ